ncbi:MAG: DeoR family transcriptional regulator, partial [Alistipes sp.]|nr:DeoR family transcriptional regulator [Alistipes sp.]
MSIAERYKYIQEQLNKYGYIRVADIANELNVTKATIRKDLRFLESQKVLYRTHG